MLTRVAHDPFSNKTAFTLIELSIVLVIVSLLIGGVLVGQELIKSSATRATISQVDKYNAAVGTFSEKYGSLPGDILPSQATKYGLYAVTSPGAGTKGYMDGNGLIQAGVLPATGEPLIFWRHLTDAQLVDGQFGTTGNNAILTDGSIGGGNKIDLTSPAAKISAQNYFAVFSSGANNFFSILPIASISSGAWVMSSSGLTPVQAARIDSKIDDGNPITGDVQAQGIGSVGSAPTAAVVPTTGRCVAGDTTGTTVTDTYNQDSVNGGNGTTCGLRFRFN